MRRTTYVDLLFMTDLILIPATLAIALFHGLYADRRRTFWCTAVHRDRALI